jgi:predicted nucleic acid-binding protein
MPRGPEAVVFDTSVYVEALRRGLGSGAADALAKAAGRTYLVSVVWAELRSGARDEDGRAALAQLGGPFAALGRVLCPRHDDWVRAGEGLADLAIANPGLRDKTRLLWNDALILLSAQQIDAHVVTANFDDFRLLQRYLGGRVAALEV